MDNTNIAQLKLACFDTETTGLEPAAGGKICEIAVSVSQGGKVLETFSTLINPQCPISPDVTAIHGITNEMVKDAPTFAQVAAKLRALFDGCVLVAHNTPFDMNFITHEFAACGQPLPDFPTLDTLKLVRKSGLFTRNNLGFVVEELGLNNHGWHRAMADTKMCEQILYHLLKILMDNHFTTLAQVKQCQYKKWSDLGIHPKEK